MLAVGRNPMFRELLLCSRASSAFMTFFCILELLLYSRASSVYVSFFCLRELLRFT